MAENDARLLIVLEAKIDKLQASLSKANSLISGHAQHVEKTLQKTDAAWGKLFQKADPGKALEAVFSRSRLGLIEEGGAKIGLFGSALEHLGVVGLAAGAGIAAAGVAVEQGIKAAEYAEALSKTAEKIGITTTALQEFDFIALKSGVSAETFRDSIEGLNQKIGQVQSGVAKAQLVNVFKALGLTPESLRDAGDVEEILKRIADRLASLPAAERAGLAARLDLAPILPALLHGRKGVEDLIAEAHRLGIVLDSDVIRKGDEAAEKLKVASDVIDKNLKGSFLALAPAIAAATGALAAFLTLLAKQQPISPNDLLSDTAKRLFVGGAPNDQVRAAEDAYRKSLGLGVTTDDITRRLGGPKPSSQVPPTAKKTHDAADDTIARMAAANEAAEAAARGLAEAQRNLTSDIDERAAFELAALKAETARQQEKLAKDLAELLKDKGIEGADSDKAQRQIEAAQRDVAAAYEAQAQAIERNADAARDEAAVRFKQRVDDYYQTVSTIQSQLADTAADRLAIEKRDLLHRQEIEREALQTENATEVINHRRTQAQADQLTAGLAAQQGAQRASFTDSHLTPLQSYLEAMRKAAADTDTAFSQLAVDGFQTFNDGLINAIVHFKSLGDVARNVLQTIEADLLRILLNKAEGAIFGALLGGIPFFADGTNSAPGGLAIVGERGPEIVNLPRGAQVIPNHDLIKSVGRLQPIASSAASQPFEFHFHAEGAVLTQEILDQASAKARFYAGIARSDAIAASRGALPGQLRTRKLLND